MAAPTKLTTEALAGGPGVTCPSSMQVTWTQIHTDLAQVNTATQLLRPSTVSTTYVIPAIVSQGTRLRIMARTDFAVSAIATSPVIRIYGANKLPNSDGSWPSGTIFHRIDSSNFTDVGTTVTLALAAAAQNDGATYCWSSQLPVDTGWDMLGAKAIMVLVETAASLTGATSTPLYAGILN